MRKIDSLLAEYGESHRNHLNKAIHWFCIPLIVFSLMGLVSSIPSEVINQFFPYILKPYINWSVIFLLITLFYYLRLSIRLAMGMLLFALFCITGNVWLSKNINLPLWQTSLIIFTLSWIGQFIGHKIEGKKPSFLKDLQFLMVGPAWLISFIYKKIGLGY